MQPYGVVRCGIETVMYGDSSQFRRGHHAGPHVQMCGVRSQFFNRIIAEFGCIVEMTSDRPLVDLVRVKAEPRFQSAKA